MSGSSKRLTLLRCVLVLPLFLATRALSGTHYVSSANTNPIVPYTNWATAALKIQDAVDAALDGDNVLVGPGIYNSGGKPIDGSGLTNRVVIGKAIRVESASGPTATVIQGSKVPGSLFGDNAVRCAYLTNGATLIGFTLLNGATRGLVGNYLTESSGGGVWCETNSSVLISNCVFSGNVGAYFSGGAYRGTLINCVISNSTAGYSFGGAYESALINCLLCRNTNGGAMNSTLNACLVVSNFGCGVASCFVTNCVLNGNNNSGAASSVLNNCILTGNSSYQGGGMYQCTANNCTITGNGANYGGGDYGSTLNNCLVYYNFAIGQPNYQGSSMNYCCTTPGPSEGVGNITTEPELASLSHLSANSPCLGAGSAAYAVGVDLDGEAWSSRPAIGCDEYHPGAAIGALGVTFQQDNLSVAPNFAVNFAALINGRCYNSRWEFGDGTVISNRPFSSHAWPTTGDYLVVLRAYNDRFPEGVGFTQTVHVAQSQHFVSLSNSNPVPPYSSWATAATSIQDAVDIALPGGSILVGDGVYATGSRVVFGASLNRVAVTRPITVRSVNGPDATAIRGFQVPGTTYGNTAVRCVYLTNGATLIGFTLSNGATRKAGDGREQYGAGAWCDGTAAVLTNCVLSGNSAYEHGGGAYGGTLIDCVSTGNHAGQHGGGAFSAVLSRCTLSDNSASIGGGGADSCSVDGCRLVHNSALVAGGTMNSTLNNCIVSSNSASNGGGAMDSTLNNCTLVGNSATYGGGGYDATFNNCVVYYNTASSSGPNYILDGQIYASINYSCTTPAPTNSIGNITDEPLLVDPV